MPTIVKMPKWGLTMTTGTITGWIREEGDEVSAGDPLLTVETEKAVNDVEAPADGVLFKIVVVRPATRRRSARRSRSSRRRANPPATPKSSR